MESLPQNPEFRIKTLTHVDRTYLLKYSGIYEQIVKKQLYNQILHFEVVSQHFKKIIAYY